MRSIILTDEQHEELLRIIPAVFATRGISEGLYREIKDVKCCKNCRWGNMDDLLCEDTGIPIPCDPGFEEGPDMYPLFCWKRK